jgi:hypothetical protein
VTDRSFTQELGLTHAEFFKSLPPAIEHRPYTVTRNTRVEIDFGDERELTIELGEQKIRRIALLRLPYCEVRFHFVGFSLEQRKSFTHRFDLYFRRGGG